jgi:hypothetical protein
MDELQLVTSPATPVENPLMAKSEGELAQLITDTQAKVRADMEQAPQGQAPVPQAPSQQGQAPTAPEPVTAPGTEVKPTVPGIEPQQEPGLTFEQLQAKQGFKSPDDLAKSYSELRKEFDRRNQAPRQEVAPPQPYVQPTPTPNTKEQFNQQFVNELSVDPLGTLLKYSRAIIASETQPLMQTQRDIALQSEVARLSSSPQTQTFRSPEVQAEIKNILNENLPKNISTAYERALGRLAIKGTSLGAMPNSASRAVPMEGSSKPVVSQPVSMNDMSIADLETAIKTLQNQLR